jgi:hypothetical protein
VRLDGGHQPPPPLLIVPLPMMHLPSEQCWVDAQSVSVTHWERSTCVAPDVLGAFPAPE